MSIETHTCPKCSKRMEEGFILEQSLSSYVPSVWVEGAPEPSFWTVTKVVKKTKRLTVTYRCIGCGYLESYANREWKGRVKPE
ncbi:MAG TPA: PF20097 family protein [Verrucomicrobiae bacterium]|nr:PF20097 family protein [Verrucomicrobiae bacterium]